MEHRNGFCIIFSKIPRKIDFFLHNFRINSKKLSEPPCVNGALLGNAPAGTRDVQGEKEMVTFREKLNPSSRAPRSNGIAHWF